MQGRLSKMENQKIQSFPSKSWKQEFVLAKKLRIKFIEWTLDYRNFLKNPIFNSNGVYEIKKLSKQNGVFVKSLTGDCFMQKPFWKKKNNQKLLNDLIRIISSCKILGIKYIVVPLVDNGSITNKHDESNLLKSCKYVLKYLKDSKVKLIFESDFTPQRLKKFIKKFDKRYFGINYDVGNSAGLNYKIDDEFRFYGKYICNVHIKDRIKYGKTVRLGNGNANFLKLFKNLKKIKYNQPLILQTARSKNNRHIEEIQINLNYLKKIHNA